MIKTLWRVEWDIDGGKGPHTSCEFGPEKTAMEWAEGLIKAGAKHVVLTELIVGRIIRIKDSDNANPDLFT